MKEILIRDIERELEIFILAMESIIRVPSHIIYLMVQVHFIKATSNLFMVFGKGANLLE